MKTRIITDSASDILEGEYENLTVLPLSITFGTATYLDGVDLTHERFYELLVEEDELPKTGQVNPYAFGQVLDEVHAAASRPWLSHSPPSSPARTRVPSPRPRRPRGSCAWLTA